MYSKTKLLEIYEEIKSHSEQNNNEELSGLAKKLYTEIQAMDVSSDDSGGSAPPPSKERG